MNGKKFKFHKVVSAIALFAMVSAPVALNAQKKSEKQKPSPKSSAPLFEIGNNKYYYEELNRVFKKNYNRQTKELSSLTCDSILDFINLYSGYRLKIMDAESRGLEKDESVRKELENNRKIVADSYYYDKVLINPNAEKMAQMRLSEKRISYMIFALPPAPNTDTTAPFQKGTAALELLKAGKSFAEVAKDFSDDKYTAEKGGVVEEFITAGKMDRTIEDIVYSLQPGEYSKELIPLQRFGYLLVKVDRSEQREFVKFRHILVNDLPIDSTTLLDIAKTKIEKIKSELSKGADFSALAREYSDDETTAKNGGLFNEWYSRSTGFEKIGNKVVTEFEDAVFKMKDGETSDIIKTKYGYHIIRKDSTKQVNLAAEHDEMKQLYRRVYLEEDKRKHLEQLKVEYGYRLNQNVFDALIAKLDTGKTNLDSNWTVQLNKEILDQVLYTFEGKNVKVSELIADMKKPGEIRGLPTNPEGIHRAIRIITDPVTIAKATADLEQTNPDFRELVQEFRDGTLLFKAEATEVWDKLKFDSTLARKYYAENSTKFYTDVTYNLQEILIKNKIEADELYNKIKNGELTFDEAASKFTQRGGYRETAGRLNRINPKLHKVAEILQKLNTKEGEFTEPQKSDIGYSIIKLNKINTPVQKSFEEAVPEIAPIIQEMTQKKLTKEWIDRLKTTYKYKINNKEINKLCK